MLSCFYPLAWVSAAILVLHSPFFKVSGPAQPELLGIHVAEISFCFVKCLLILIKVFFSLQKVFFTYVELNVLVSCSRVVVRAGKLCSAWLGLWRNSLLVPSGVRVATPGTQRSVFISPSFYSV